jgi:hypothetical protein
MYKAFSQSTLLGRLALHRVTVSFGLGMQFGGEWKYESCTAAAEESIGIYISTAEVVRRIFQTLISIRSRPRRCVGY